MKNNNPSHRGAIKREKECNPNPTIRRCYSTKRTKPQRGFSMRTITRIAAAINTDRTVFFLAGLNAGLNLLWVVMQ